MRRAFVSVAPLVLVSFLALPLAAYGQDSTASISGDVNSFLTVKFPVEQEIEVDLRATSRLPDADGKAEIENEEGTTRIEVKLDDLKAAVLFGGDFNTYVLWLITPEGEVQNLGELILDGEQAELKATTPLSNFGMFVTAEPHFLVDFPSRMVVLQMEKPEDNRLRDYGTAQLRYEGTKGMYDFTRETLAGAPEIERDDVAYDVAQARAAVRLAERSGAARSAAVELQAARQALQRAEEALATEKDSDNRIALSREAVRLAVRAGTVAQERLVEAQLEEERERNNQEAERLRSAIAAAQSETEKARLEAEQQRLQARMEQQARERAQERAEALRTEAARAREQARSAQEQSERLRAEERGRQQGFNEARQTFEQAQESARLAEQRFQELSLEQQRLEQTVLEAERALRQAEQAQQQPGNTPAAQEQVERARAELEQARQEAEQSRRRALQAEEEAQRAKQSAAQRQQELESERQVRQQTERQLNQLQTEQTRTREQLREALGQIAETRETVEGLVVNLPDILFEFDSASLKPQAREILQKLAQTLGSAGKYKITIEGHTDSVGRPEYNRELSQSRAQSVKEFLVQSGLDSSLIVEVRGMGETEPRASNDDAGGRQENRRVEILVQEPTAPARAE